MLKHLFIGLLLGWGAAVPLGPVNLELIRRNLHLGTLISLAFGAGACLADVTFLLALSFGIINIFTYPWLLRTIGILGACIILWFAYKVLTAKITARDADYNDSVKQQPLWRHLSEGYLITLL